MLKVSRYNNYLTEQNRLFIFNSCYNSAICISDIETYNRIMSWLPDMIIDEKEYEEGLLNALESQGMLVDSKRNETDYVNYLYYKTLRAKTLNLILIVTRNCNFDCPYCYEKHEAKKMDEDVFCGIIKFIQQKKEEGYTSLEIGWFGGEPLLEYDMIISFMRNLHTIFDDMKIVGSMTTNGFLLSKERLNELCDLSVNKYQITIDGLEKDHNKTRVLKGGSGTWKTIISNLLAAQESDIAFSFMIRTNFSEEMYQSSSEWIDYIANTFGKDPRFSFHFEAVKNLGKPNEFAMFSQSSTTELFEDMGEKSLQKGFTLPMIQQMMFPTGAICYAANPHSFTIDYDGKVRKCTVAIDDEKNNIGQIDKDGFSRFNAVNFSWWVSYDPYEECKKCSIYPICMGKKCPNSYLSENGCETIKAVYRIGMKRYIKQYFLSKSEDF